MCVLVALITWARKTIKPVTVLITAKQERKIFYYKVFLLDTSWKQVPTPPTDKSLITSCQVRSFQLFRLDFFQQRWSKAMPSRLTEDLLAVDACIYLFQPTLCTPSLRDNYICTVQRSSVVARLRDLPDTMAENMKRKYVRIWKWSLLLRSACVCNEHTEITGKV